MSPNWQTRSRRAFNISQKISVCSHGNHWTGTAALIAGGDYRLFLYHLNLMMSMPGAKLQPNYNWRNLLVAVSLGETIARAHICKTYVFMPH